MEIEMLFFPRIRLTDRKLSPIFADINECSLPTYPCHKNASCGNTAGSFRCACLEGLDGNGFLCFSEWISSCV